MLNQNTTISLNFNNKSIPSIKSKTNELFYKWLSEPERTEQLKEVISLIRNNNRIPRLNELKSFKYDLNKTPKQSDQLTLFNQTSQQIYQQTYQINLNINNSNNARSKSPPSIHSPPMSPINRMPQSPKSPRQRAINQNNQKLIFNNKDQLNNSNNSDDYGLNNLKIQTSTSTNQTKIGQKQQPPQLLIQQQPQQAQQPLLKPSEKEILIQKVTSTTNNTETQVAQQPQIESKLKQESLVLKSDVKTLNKSPSQVKQSQIVEKPKINIPQFYYPHGKPDEKSFKSYEDTETMKQIGLEFKKQKDGKMFKDEFGDVCKLLNLPRYWKILLFRACTFSSKLNYLTYSQFEQTWSKLSHSCYDRASMFMKLISNTGYVVYEDWEPLLQDIVDSHPGLKFLHDHKEFHTRYIKTVIARIYYTVNRSWSGRITLTELKRSNFLSVLETLELEDDINLIKDYFSYEHFYVIYCKFWELDKDHDLYISKEDLYRHNNYSISPKVIDRIFSGTVIRSRDWRDGLMSYYDFVWFLISEEDKRNPTSVEYWFRVLDLDGDGVLSMYELEYFYNEQIEQMRERQIEYMPFTDLLCQMLDLVKPLEHGKIRLKDLKQCKMSNVFFDTFINLEKYLEYEQRDPFSNMRDLEGPEQSDWEKYAAYEYENLVSEDVNGDNQEMYQNYDDDFEDEPLMFNNGSAANPASSSVNTNGGLN